MCSGHFTDHSLLVANRRYDFGWGNGLNFEEFQWIAIGNQLLPGEWIELESPSFPHFLTSHALTLQPYGAPRHDYCLRTAPHALAAVDESVWVRGRLLIANEAHIENFHHANRDSLFLHRFVRRFKDDVRVSGIAVAHAGDVADWVVEHMRAVLPPPLLRRTVWASHPRRPLQSKKRRLSNASLLSLGSSPPLSLGSSPPLHLPMDGSAEGDSPGRESDAAARHALASRPPRYVCFDAAAEKVVAIRGSLPPPSV